MINIRLIQNNDDNSRWACTIFVDEVKAWMKRKVGPADGADGAIDQTEHFDAHTAGN